MKHAICLLFAFAMFVGFGGVAQAACISRAAPDDAGDAGRVASTVTFTIPDPELAAYMQKGFVSAVCPQEAAQKTARDSMCAAAMANEAVQARIAAVVGERPERLCAMASAVLGEAHLSRQLPADRVLDGPVADVRESPPAMGGAPPLAQEASVQSGEPVGKPAQEIAR